MLTLRFLVLLLLSFFSGLASAEVSESDASSFTLSYRIVVPVGNDVSYREILHPARWWSSEHTWSGDAKNLSVEPRAGGCWCERWKDGEVEHARVVYIARNKRLRISGGIGPLQAMPVTALMDFAITPGKDGSQIDVTYRVAGPASAALDKIAPAVDGVLDAQMDNLRSRLLKLDPRAAVAH